MQRLSAPTQYLVSLPPAMAALFEELEQRPRPRWFAAGDPPGQKLGSGGGTAHLLVEAWRATGGGQSLDDWLNNSRKLIVHGAGESRRLPAYAAVGKPLLPVPPFADTGRAQKPQTLLDRQLPFCERVFRHAPERAAVLIASGDTLLRFGEILPPLPDVDVLGFGMFVPPERAARHGVFFVPKDKLSELAFFLQKPSPARIAELAADYDFLVDTGLWVLSARAVEVLLRRCAWNAARGEFAGGLANRYELYDQFGLSLGRAPAVPDAEIGALTSAVARLPQPEFHHFGTSRQIVESVSALRKLELARTQAKGDAPVRIVDQYVQNSRFNAALDADQNRTLWVENSSIPRSWHLAHDHVLVGVPANDWPLQLEPGICLDFTPVGETDCCLRYCGMDDAFRGALHAPETLWLGCPAANWFHARGMEASAAGLEPGRDIFTAPLFPILPAGKAEPAFLEWLFSRRPVPNPAFARRWLEGERLSAQQIPARANFRRLYAQRAANRG